MNLRALISILLVTFILASAQEWFPFVWALLQSRNNVEYIGKLERISNQCDQDNSPLVCRGSYKIDSKLLLSPDGKRRDLIGLGFFQTDFKIKCQNEVVYQSFSDKGYSLTFDSYKIYKTVPIKDLECNKKEDIILDIYTTKALKTFGQISSNALIGNKEFILTAKRTIEFLATGIYLVCGILLWFAWLSEYVILKNFASQYRSREEISDRSWGWIILVWGLFSLFKSGIIDILSATPTSVDILFRIQTASSLIAHTQLSIWMISSSPKRRNFAILILLGLYLPLSFTTSFNMFLAISAASINSIGLVFAIHRRMHFQFIFSTLAICEVLKVFNFKFFPSGSLTIIFMTLVYFFECLKFLRVAGIFASANLWFRRFSKQIQNQNDLKVIFQSISKEMETGKITAFLLGKDDMHNIWSYDDRNSEELEITHVNFVPGPFAHVISTDSPLLHLNSESEFSKNLFKRAPNKNYGILYSILPLKSHGKVIGVIAASRYKKDGKLFQVPQKERMEAYLSVFSECISIVSSNLEKNIEDQTYQQFLTIIHKLKTDFTFKSIAEFSGKLLTEIYYQTSWRGFLGVLDKQSNVLEIVASNYEYESGGNFLKGQKWEMLKENVRAPAPIALHYGKTVFVPNINWLNENISTNTKHLFKATRMGSFVAIPLRRREGNQYSPIALLWISSENFGQFDTSFERCAQFIQESIEGEIQQLINISIGEKVFSDIIRDDIREKLLRGEAPTEPGIGSLIMADIVGSTAISKHLGPDKWKSFQNDFIKICKYEGEKIGLQSEIFVWDALFLTTHSIISERELLKFSINVVKQVISLNKKFNTTALITNEIKAVRICATYGDINREVSNGAWAITGHAMARVCKLEQFMKPQDLLISISHDLLAKWELNQIIHFKITNNSDLSAAEIGLDLMSLKTIAIKRKLGA